MSSSTQDINRALSLAKNAQRPDRLPLRVLAGGLRLEGTMPGDLYAWARLSDGQWLCCNHRLELTVDHSVVEWIGVDGQ